MRGNNDTALLSQKITVEHAFTFFLIKDITAFVLVNHVV